MRVLFRIIIVGSVLFLSYVSVTAQSGEVIIKSDGDLSRSVIDSLKYVLPQFERGTIYFEDGQKSEGIFNINTIVPSMSFIQNNKDTLILRSEIEKIVSAVFFGERVWRKIGGYMEIVDSYSGVELGVERRLVFEPPKKEVGYGVISESAAVDNYKYYESSGLGFNLSSRYVNVPYRYSISTFILQDGKRTVPNKKLMKKIFPGKDKAIDSYIKSNDINFRKAEDIKKLFAYCKSL